MVQEKIVSSEKTNKDEEVHQEEFISPEIRFPEFIESWEEVQLKDIASFSKGKGISKNETSEKGIPCIRYGELYTKYDENITKIYSKTNLEIENLVLSEKNDILIPCSGETAIDLATASCVRDKNVAIGGDITIIKTNQYPPFITYCLNNKRTEIAKYAQGVSIVHLYAKDFQNIKIKIPQISEQKKIVYLFENLNKKIDSLEKKQNNLLNFKKIILKKIFIEDKLNSWKKYKISNLGVFKSGYAFKNKYQGFLNYDIPFFKVSDMNLNKKYMKKSQNTVNEEMCSNMKCKILEKPSIIIAKLGEAIYLERKRIANKQCIIDNNLLAFQPHDNFDLEFIYYMFLNYQLSKYAQQTAVPSLSPKDIGDIKCFVPNSIIEQQKIAEIFLTLDKKIELNEKSLSETKKFKKALLQKMFI